jgi:hypothetical protein
MRWWWWWFAVVRLLFSDSVSMHHCRGGTSSLVLLQPLLLTAITASSWLYHLVPLLLSPFSFFPFFFPPLSFYSRADAFNFLSLEDLVYLQLGK